jgi:hypothetical protein
MLLNKLRIREIENSVKPTRTSFLYDIFVRRYVNFKTDNLVTNYNYCMALVDSGHVIFIVSSTFTPKPTSLLYIPNSIKMSYSTSF